MKPIRVLQVIPGLTTDGISSVVMNWYRNIDRNKIQFDFITFNEGILRHEIESLGAKIYLIKTFKQNPREHINSVNHILHTAQKYDVIHVHNSFKNVVMLKLAKNVGIPIRVCHSHTSGLEKKSLAPVFSILRYFTRKYSNVHLACGKEAGTFLFGNKSFQILNNAIHVDNILKGFITSNEIYKKYAIPQNKRLIILVARFSIVKNHQFLVTLAQSKILAEDIHFLCVGDGPLKNELAESIIQKQLNNRFTLLPANQDIPNLLSISDGFIMPSLFEGVSVALLEAQAASLICLASDTIPSEVNMDLNNLTFLSLQQPQQWVEALNKTEKEVIIDERVNKHFDDRGYSVSSVIKHLETIYQVPDKIIS